MSIPKIIHYCWLSGDPFPEDIQRCIDSWRTYMPDYELRLWDRKRFDCDSIPYVKRALERKKYAFASDFIRLYALYHEGGIYLDSDIEVLRSFDSLLTEAAFTGFECGGRAAAWIFGSAPGNPVIRELLDYYDGKEFIGADGKTDLTPNTIPVTKTLIRYGLKGCDRIQRLDGITVFPSEYFCPLNPWSGEERRTSNTFARHLFKGAWMEGDEEVQFMREYEACVDDYVKAAFPERTGHMIIYGAGILGHLVFGYLREKYRKIRVDAFLETQRQFMWDTIEGIPLLEVADSSRIDRDTPVLVATVPKHHGAIVEELMEHGFRCVACMG